MKTRRILIIGGVISAIAVSGYITIWLTGNSSPAFPLGYPRIPQNDLHCMTQWWIEPTIVNVYVISELILGTIAGFGSHLDIPDREVFFPTTMLGL